MKTRVGHLQIRLPECVEPFPYSWAIELNWYSKGNRPGRTEGHAPHLSIVIASAMAGLSRESTATRNRILRNGARFIREEEVRLAVPGAARMRVFRIKLGRLERIVL